MLLPKTPFPRTRLLIVNGLFVAALLSTGCSYTFAKQEEVEPVQANTVSPEIDHSNEAPGCALAAQRIKEYVVVGMTLGDVRRLVGQPRLILPGNWLWTNSLGSKASSGKPVVRYGFTPSADDVPIKSFSSDSHGC